MATKDPTERHRTAVAFDWGLRSIGTAVGQTLTKTARPLQTLPARDGIPNWDAVNLLLEEWRPDVVVVGLPLELDGTESEFCASVRRFGRRIAGRFGHIVEFQDERHSTQEARARATENAHRRELHDLAAQVILEDWLRAQR
ncbi:MAG TPA: Holliday junction resolvase RuvX [Pseudomonadales bacterium]|nr:Holliday junction resolvase RuvX [Pseudomonadales bacterium]